MARFMALAFGVLMMVACSSALIHHLEIRNDARQAFFIESFGFDANGFLNLTVKNFKTHPEVNLESSNVGFLIARNEQQDTHRLVEEHEDNLCLFDLPPRVFESRVYVR